MSIKQMFKKEFITETDVNEGDFLKGYSTKQVAKDVYEIKYNEVENQLKAALKGLKKHKALFKKSGETDWGYVGDLGYVQEQLDTIKTSFGN